MVLETVRDRLTLPPFPFNNNRLLEGLVFYAPMWHERTHLNGAMKSPFLSLDRNHHSCSVTGTTLTRLASGIDAPGFDAVDDVIIVPDAASIRNLADFTIIAWVYRRSNGENGAGRILDKNASTLFITLQADITFNRDYGTTMSYITNNSPLTLNTWKHVVCRMYSADKTGSIFVDNVEATYGTANAGTGTLANDTDDLYIGDRAASNRSADAIIGELWIYNTALTNAQCRQARQLTRWRYI